MLTSRKWKAVLIDAIFLAITTAISLLLKVDDKSLAAIIAVVVAFQGAVIAYINGTAKEDAAAKSAGMAFQPEGKVYIPEAIGEQPAIVQSPERPEGNMK